MEAQCRFPSLFWVASEAGPRVPAIHVRAPKAVLVSCLQSGPICYCCHLGSKAGDRNFSLSLLPKHKSFVKTTIKIRAWCSNLVAKILALRTTGPIGAPVLIPATCFPSSCLLVVWENNQNWRRTSEDDMLPHGSYPARRQRPSHAASSPRRLLIHSRGPTHHRQRKTATEALRRFRQPTVRNGGL